MTRMLPVGLALAALLVLSAVPAAADHRTTADATPTEGVAAAADLDLDVKLGVDGFYGAWLNGQVHPDGFTLDGRVQRDSRAFNFKLNTELMDPLSRFAWRWWLNRP